MTEPTDAELKAMWQLHAADIGGIFCYARAVLAKWGQPAQAAEPVAREPLTDAQIAEMMRDTWGCASIAPRHALAFARAVERAHGITQAGAEPLTDEQIQDLLLCGDPTDEEMRLIRIGWDAANGIKGGQHG